MWSQIQIYHGCIQSKPHAAYSAADFRSNMIDLICSANGNDSFAGERHDFIKKTYVRKENGC